jgi:cell division protein FtsQ
MIKKILHIVVWLGILCWFIFIMGFVSKSGDQLLCNRIIIEISDSTDVKFVTSEDVRSMITDSDIDIQGYPLLEINSRRLEAILENNPYIENTEAYTTINGDLFVDVEQRRPILRVMPGGRRGYYIDTNGEFLPLSSSYTPMVLLITGYLSLPQSMMDAGLAPRDSTDVEYQYIHDVLELARYIDENQFWKDQIVQIYRNRKGEFEIIPRVGAHQILLGTLDNYKEKLRNLKLLYEQGFQKYGWNNYNQINLKYSNQVICTKR